MPPIDDLPPPPSSARSSIDDLPAPPPDMIAAAPMAGHNASNTPKAASAAAGFMSFPFAHQIGAAGKTAMDVATGVTPIGESLDEYRQQRDTLKKDLDETQAVNPKTAFVGSLGGTSMIPLQGQGAMGLFGAAQGLSNSNADLTKGEFGQAANDAARGWAIGQVTGDAVDQGGKILSKMAPKLRAYLERIAENRSAKGMGAMKSDYRRLGEDKLRAAGRYALDNDVISPLSGTETMLDRNAAVQDAAMSDRKQIYDLIDNHQPSNGARMTPDIEPAPIESYSNQISQSSRNPYDRNYSAPQGDLGFKLDNPNGPSQVIPDNPYGMHGTSGASQFNPLEAAQNVDQSVGGFERSSPLNSGATNQLDKIMDAIRMRGNGNISMNDAQKLVEELQKQAKFDTTRSNGANSVAKSAYSSARGYLNDSAEKAADIVGGQGFKQRIQDANRKYSAGETVNDLLEKQMAGHLGNKTFGLTDTIAAAGGPAGIPGKIATVGLKKTAEKYGNQMTAVGTDWIASKVAQSPQAFGRWAPALTAAAQRGGTALPATDFMLQSTDPEYRQHIRALQEQQQNRSPSDQEGP